MIAGDPNDLTLPALYAELASGGLARRLFELARDEDLGPAGIDITTASTHHRDRRVRARIVLRQPGIVSGLAALPDLIEVFGAQISIATFLSDGDEAAANTVVAELRGSAHAILKLERTALNVLGRLSGIATRTRDFVAELHRSAPESPARLLDTRKTTPGLRVLEKYAVRCGGGFCHRLGLHDAVLIKDNHLAGLSPAEIGAFVTRAAGRARAAADLAFLEVEADTLEQLDALLAIAPGTIEIVLLDNMPVETMREAVARRNARAPALLLEASGGVTRETLGQIARTGVDRISIGGLTHQAVSLDVALDIAEEPAR